MSPTFLLRPCLLAVTVLAGGCGVLHETCNEPQPYETAVSAAPIKVPEGLAAPNTKSALTIPDVAGQRKKLTRKDACRDAPPAYFENKPAG